MKSEIARQFTFKSWKSRALLLFCIVLIAFAGLLPYSAPAPASAATTYIYATFKGDAAPDEKLWIYTSSNGTSFTHLYNGFGGPTGVLRDPSIMKHSDGLYYIAFTVQSWTTNSTYFAIASSPNLTTWTNVTTVNSGIANTKFTWAPEWFIEGSTVRIICSIGTTAGGDFRPYVYTAQNTALTSWSGPSSISGIGANTIDTFVIKSGSTYHAFVKDENTKFIKHATSASLMSGWSAFTNMFVSGYEGPSAIQLDDGTFRIYIDKYTAGGIWTATSSNLSSWSSLSLMGAYRHGTVLKDANYTGGPTATPGPTPTTNPNTSVNDFTTGTGQNQFNYTGTWSSGSQTGAYQSDNHWRSVTNDAYQVAFTGTQVKIYSAKANNHGIFAVSIDGGSETMVDLYAATRADQVLVWTSPVLTSGSHTVKVRITGTKNASSSGASIIADRVDVIQ